MAKLFVISVGGSIIVPEGIDTSFLKQFRALILNQVKKGNKFILVAGGGHIARMYQQASQQAHPSRAEKDELGIAATALNALLLKTLFHN